MAKAPITVHPASPSGGRRVTANGQILGLAHSDADVVEFLRRAGLEEADQILDNPLWVSWRGGHAHEYEAA
ncbi:hypothetical protein ABT160_04630 [Streptomyces sp. NPDC001941]|uniref:hypothetical protein n=1 Tax=Streptomyces sp. NPDC001941 TaxID=3154659 RepID=UPI003326D6A1